MSMSSLSSMGSVSMCLQSRNRDTDLESTLMPILCQLRSNRFSTSGFLRRRGQHPSSGPRRCTPPPCSPRPDGWRPGGHSHYSLIKLHYLYDVLCYKLIQTDFKNRTFEEDLQFQLCINYGLIKTHLWDAIFVIDLPQVPVFFTRGLPELKCGHKGIFIWQTLR